MTITKNWLDITANARKAILDSEVIAPVAHLKLDSAAGIKHANAPRVTSTTSNQTPAEKSLNSLNTGHKILAIKSLNTVTHNTSHKILAIKSLNTVTHNTGLSIASINISHQIKTINTTAQDTPAIVELTKE